MQVKRLKDELEMSKGSGRAMAARLEKSQQSSDTPDKTKRPKGPKKPGEAATDPAKPEG